MAAQSNELMLCEVRTSKKLREMSVEIPLEVHGVESLFPLGFREAFLKDFCSPVYWSQAILLFN